MTTRPEVPIPTVVEITHKAHSRSTVRWKVCWSDGTRSSLDHTSLEIACEWAAYEYLGRYWWAEEQRYRQSWEVLASRKH